MSFSKAVEFVRRTDTGMSPSQSDKLQFYALYKQATEGDVSGPAPSMMDFAGKAKYNAWNNQKGTSKQDAEAKYVEALNKLCPDWQSK